MRVIGVVSGAPRPLDGNGSSGKKYDTPLHSFAIEGVNILIPSDLVPSVPARGEVSAIVSVRWPKEAGKKPTHWLQSITVL